MFQQNFLFLSQLVDPDYIICFGFGVVMILFFYLQKLKQFKTLIIALSCLEGLFLWKILVNWWFPTLHVVSENLEKFSLLFLTHRWFLLLPIPLFLTTSLIILAIYQNKIFDPHAKDYYRSVFFLLLASLVLFILSMMESFF